MVAKALARVAEEVLTVEFPTMGFQAVSSDGASWLVTCRGVCFGFPPNMANGFGRVVAARWSEEFRRNDLAARRNCCRSLSWE